MTSTMRSTVRPEADGVVDRRVGPVGAIGSAPVRTRLYRAARRGDRTCERTGDQVQEPRRAGGGNWLAGIGPGTEMADRVRSLDWAATPLGPVEDWSIGLRTAVRLCLASDFAMLVVWGPELIQIYNDRYREVLGSTKHPAALGEPAERIWTEIWDEIGPMFHEVIDHRGPDLHRARSPGDRSQRLPRGDVLHLVLQPDLRRRRLRRRGARRGGGDDRPGSRRTAAVHRGRAQPRPPARRRRHRHLPRRHPRPRSVHRRRPGRRHLPAGRRRVGARRHQPPHRGGAGGARGARPGGRRGAPAGDRPGPRALRPRHPRGHAHRPDRRRRPRGAGDVAATRGRAERRHPDVPRLRRRPDRELARRGRRSRPRARRAPGHQRDAAGGHDHADRRHRHGRRPVRPGGRQPLGRRRLVRPRRARPGTGGRSSSATASATAWTRPRRWASCAARPRRCCSRAATRRRHARGARHLRRHRRRRLLRHGRVRGDRPQRRRDHLQPRRSPSAPAVRAGG